MLCVRCHGLAPWRFTIAAATARNPRNSESDIIQLRDGRLLLGWTEFYAGNGADDGTARIVGRVSTDGGRTWGALSARLRLHVHLTNAVPLCQIVRMKDALRIVWGLVMDVMDRLYEVYAADFEDLVGRARRIAEEDGSPNPERFWAQQLSPQQFRTYLMDSSRQSETKRWFLRGLLRGNEELESELPAHLVALLAGSVVRPPHFLNVPERSLR